MEQQNRILRQKGPYTGLKGRPLIGTDTNGRSGTRRYSDWAKGRKADSQSNTLKENSEPPERVGEKMGQGP